MMSSLRLLSPRSIAQRWRSQPGWYTGLGIITLFAAFAVFWDLSTGSRSEYYSAFPVGMSKSLSNFWFGAMDPAGTITLDKIPGSYWLPAIFVAIFGFSTVSVILPNALATVALALVVAYTGRRLAGNQAGILAGFLVAATPIVAAVGRSNQPETMFLLTLAIATYWSVRAVQSARRRYLVYAGIWIGVAFQCYMIEAWALWPALILGYLLTNLSWLRKIIDLTLAGLSSLAVSLVWVVSVALTPASARPYIGGSNTNSGFEMVFGYNALGRFGGSSATYRSFTPPFSGGPSPFRLFNGALVGQIGWLILVTVVAIALLLWRHRRGSDFPILVFISGFFVVFAIMFSVVAGMHQFYTAALAIPIALVISFAVINLLDDAFSLGVLIALALAATMHIAFQSPQYLLWVAILQFVIAVSAFAWMLIGVSQRSRKWFVPLIALSLALTPAAWSADAHGNSSSINPVAGPVVSGPMQTGSTSGPGQASQLDAEQVAYLKANAGTAKYQLAVFGAQTAAQYITGFALSVLPIGGFSGEDPAPTLSQFKQLITDGDLRFVRTGGMGGFGGGRSGASSGTANEISSWVETNCQLADYAGNAGDLYRCGK